MKKIIITFSAIILVNLAYGQTIRPIEELLDAKEKFNSNTYFQDVNNVLTPYVGSWTYQTANVTFNMTITKRKELYNEKYKIWVDRLIIKYALYIEGICKYYNISPFNAPTGAITTPSELTGVMYNNEGISLAYYEPSTTGRDRDKVGMLTLKVISGTPLHLQWTRSSTVTIIESQDCTGSIIDTSPFQIPATMYLTKL